MDFFNRHRNLIVLAAVLFAQVLGLAVQVRRPAEGGPVRLVHLWGIGLVTPVEYSLVHSGNWARNAWRNYLYLRDVRRENAELERENLRLRLEQVRLAQDASQAQRLQALLQFKEQFISDTVAAQVIGSSGSEQSRVIYIDKGSKDGIKNDMAVVAPAGIVGKVVRVLPNTAQVLEINDQSSGVGAILEKSRLQGIVKGSLTGEVMLQYVMSDEKVENGEMALTSGGDRVFPKGLPIGQVVQVSTGADTFLRIRVRPAARLDRLEEVLIITRVVEKDREAIPEAPMRASEILAQRLPTVPPKPPDVKAAATAASGGTTPAPAGANAPAAGTNLAASGANPSPKPAASKPALGSGASAAGTKPPVDAKRKDSGNQGGASPATKPPASGAAQISPDVKSAAEIKARKAVTPSETAATPKDNSQ